MGMVRPDVKHLEVSLENTWQTVMSFKQGNYIKRSVFKKDPLAAVRMQCRVCVALRDPLGLSTWGEVGCVGGGRGGGLRRPGQVAQTSRRWTKQDVVTDWVWG